MNAAHSVPPCALCFARCHMLCRANAVSYLRPNCTTAIPLCVMLCYAVPCYFRYLTWQTDDLTALGPVLSAYTHFTTLRGLSLSCSRPTLQRRTAAAAATAAAGGGGSLIGVSHTSITLAHIVTLTHTLECGVLGFSQRQCHTSTTLLTLLVSHTNALVPLLSFSNVARCAAGAGGARGGASSSGESSAGVDGGSVHWQSCAEAFNKLLPYCRMAFIR